MTNLIEFLKSESGSSAINYCFISGTITVAIAEPLHQTGKQLSTLFLTIAKVLAVHG